MIGKEPRALTANATPKPESALASSSATSERARIPASWPPYSFGTQVRMRPAAARALAASMLYLCFSSCSAAPGRTTSSAIFRAMAWSSRACSLKTIFCCMAWYAAPARGMEGPRGKGMVGRAARPNSVVPERAGPYAELDLSSVGAEFLQRGGSAPGEDDLALRGPGLERLARIEAPRWPGSGGPP